VYIRAGDRIVSGENRVLMIYLTEKDKKNIADMHSDCNVYCQMPNDIPEKYIDRVLLIMKMFKEDVQNELTKPTSDSPGTDDKCL